MIRDHFSRKPLSALEICTMKATTAIALSRAAILSMIVWTAASAGAQDRLKTMPGYEQKTRMAPLSLSGLGGTGQGFGGRGGGGGATWAADGKSFDFDNSGKRFHFDIATKAVTEASPNAGQQQGGRGGRGGGAQPARGRQFDFA